MLKFQRNKLVSIYRKGADRIKVHGLLDDHIFGLEIDITIHLNDLSIHEIGGRWHREETPECSRALPFLEEAVGFKIDEEAIGQKIHKIVSRKSCPHFANLLLECCDAAKEAAAIIRWEQATADQPDLTFEAYTTGAELKETEKKPAASGMKTIEATMDTVAESSKIKKEHAGDGCIIDLHVHSFPASQCSIVSVDDLIIEAKRIGLDAVCLTDHNHVWSVDAIENLRQKHGFNVLRGNEITSDQGDMLVFGMHKNIRGIIRLSELKQLVDEADGFMIAAHPFRGFLVFNTSQIGMTVEKAMERSAFNYVHAVEVLNGKVTEKENLFARDVADGLHLPVTGGSDAHEISEVGKYATCFKNPVRNERELLEALKSGDYEPHAYRKEASKGSRISESM